jgi:hypothetical protein
MRPDPSGERIFRDFTVLDRGESKTAHDGLESDLVRQGTDLPRHGVELAQCNPALCVSAEVLGELGQDADQDEQVRFASKKARTRQTKDQCGCTEVRHGHPRVRSVFDATRFPSAAERVGRNEVGGGLQEVRRRWQEVRDRDDEVRVPSSASRFESAEDGVGRLTDRLVTDEVQSRSSAFRCESAQDRAGCKKVRFRRTQVRDPSTEVRFPSTTARFRSGAPRRRSSKASS